MYAFALRNTTVNHIRGCVVKILYPTLPRFQSKMAIVWDRSIVFGCIRQAMYRSIPGSVLPRVAQSLHRGCPPNEMVRNDDSPL